jgi:hypothetical protein
MIIVALLSPDGLMDRSFNHNAKQHSSNFCLRINIPIDF